MIAAPEFLLAAELIEFADSQVKALCVAKWDSDGDGELSVEEAATVTSLGGVFCNQKTITTFDELQHFIGLTSIDDYAFSQSSIVHVTLPPTVTYIGKHAFSASSIGSSFRVPGTVKEIGDYAFYDCEQLTSVVLEEGVETVGWHTFSGPIATLILPSSLKFMYSMAVNPYVNAAPSAGIFIPKGNLTVVALSSTPAPINDYAFYYVFTEGHLIVPMGTLDAYKSEKAWSHFRDYIEVGDVNRDGRLDITDVTLLIAYIQGREHTEIEARIADVNGDGVLDGEDVSQLCQYLLGS